jgi:hypothetical protein
MRDSTLLAANVDITKYDMMHPTLCILTFGMLLAGCLSSGETRLPGGTYRLQPAADAAPINEWQEIVLTHPKGQQKLLSHVLNTPTRTRLTILDPTTLTTLASCSYEDGHAQLAGPLATDGSIPAELPLAILQLSEWPNASIYRGLTGGLRLTTLSDRRLLQDDETTIAEIEILPDHVRIIRLPHYGTTIRVTPTRQP